jgi:hypothetical protein
MATRLSDGIPVTTEWLNNLVDEINVLRNGGGNSGGQNSTAAATVVDFFGPGLSGSSSIQVLTGTVTGQVTASADVFEADVNFAVPFADANVFVVCTPTFASTGSRNGKPAKAAASVCSVTDSLFKLAVMLVDDGNQTAGSKQVTVNYIAIGKKK